MFNVYYDMINKRKSFHTMPGGKKVSGPELNMINGHFDRLVPLCDDIKVAFKIVQRRTTTWKWGEYAILVYSEKKPNYLANIGYMVQQLEMFLTALDIGTCWCGIGKPAPEDETYEGMDFAIMLIMEKSEEGEFRKSMHEAKRREADKIKKGEGPYLNVHEVNISLAGRRISRLQNANISLAQEREYHRSRQRTTKDTLWTTNLHLEVKKKRQRK